MPEELALEQVLRNGGAVESDERLFGPRALVVQGLGDELLARAALTGHQHRRLERRHHADRPEDLLHARRVADDVVRTVATPDFPAQVLELGVARGVPRGTLDDDQELFDVEGLGHVVERAELHGGDRRLDGLGRRQHQHRHPLILLLDALEHDEAVDPRHEHVEEHEIGLHLSQHLERLFARLASTASYCSFNTIRNDSRTPGSSSTISTLRFSIVPPSSSPAAGDQVAKRRPRDADHRRLPRPARTASRPPLRSRSAAANAHASGSVSTLAFAPGSTQAARRAATDGPVRTRISRTPGATP